MNPDGIPSVTNLTESSSIDISRNTSRINLGKGNMVFLSKPQKSMKKTTRFEVFTTPEKKRKRGNDKVEANDDPKKNNIGLATERRSMPGALKSIQGVNAWKSTNKHSLRETPLRTSTNESIDDRKHFEEDNNES